jgi:hypothetical protein
MTELQFAALQLTVLAVVVGVAWWFSPGRTRR